MPALYKKAMHKLQRDEAIWETTTQLRFFGNTLCEATEQVYTALTKAYSTFLELRSPLVRATPILDLSFLGPSGPHHGTLKVASRLISPYNETCLGVWGSG